MLLRFNTSTKASPHQHKPRKCQTLQQIKLVEGLIRSKVKFSFGKKAQSAIVQVHISKVLNTIKNTSIRKKKIIKEQHAPSL